MKKEILGAIILATILAFTFVSAAVTLNVPLTGKNYTTITFNCSTDEGATWTTDSGANASIFYNNSGTTKVADATTGTYLGKIDAVEANDSDFTGSISVESLADLSTYNFTCVLDNTSAFNWSLEGVPDVGIDNTDPIVTLVTDVENSTSVGLNRLFRYTISISDAFTLGSNYGCSITRPDGVAVDITTTSATNKEYDKLDVAGDYVVNCSATDTASNYAVSNATISVKSLGYAQQTQTSNWDTNGTTAKFDLMKLLSENKILVLIIAVVVVIALNNKKR